MSRPRTDDTNRSRPPVVRSTLGHHSRPAEDSPPLAVQVGLVAAIVATVVVASYPVVTASAVAVAVFLGVLTTAVGRSLHVAAARETTVRVPGSSVEVTLAHSSSE
jgi:hypothetical protein